MGEIMLDPEYCEHEWWEPDYTTYPKLWTRERRCRLCGAYLTLQPTEAHLKKEGWKKVQDNANH